MALLAVGVAQSARRHRQWPVRQRCCITDPHHSFRGGVAGCIRAFSCDRSKPWPTTPQGARRLAPKLPPRPAAPGPDSPSNNQRWSDQACLLVRPIPPSRPPAPKLHHMPLLSGTCEKKRCRTRQYTATGWFPCPGTHTGTAVPPACERHRGVRRLSADRQAL